MGGVVEKGTAWADGFEEVITDPSRGQVDHLLVWRELLAMWNWFRHLHPWFSVGGVAKEHDVTDRGAGKAGRSTGRLVATLQTAAPADTHRLPQLHTDEQA